MRKWTATILTFCITTACVLTLAGGLCAFSTQPVFASAETQKDELVLPASYEEYLPLDTPKDVAVSERYTAIADSNVLYLYDRQTQNYRTYTHEQHGTDSSKNVITQIQFDDEENLYFTDDFTSDNLYFLNTQTFTAPTPVEKVACSTFLIYGDDLYFTNAAGTLYFAPDFDAAHAQDIVTNVSAIAMQHDDLYLVRSELYLHKLHAPTTKISDSEMQGTSVATLYGSVNAFAVQEGGIAYTTVSGDFYFNPVTVNTLDKNEVFLDKVGYAGLSQLGDYTYAVQNDRIRQFDGVNGNFTNYEIGASSPSTNRLHGATETLLFNDTLFIADNGNARISVFDAKQNKITTTFPSPLSPSFMSTDGETLLTASETQIVLYSLAPQTFGEQLTQFSSFNGNVKGVASVYGTHYIASEGYVYTLTQNDTKAWIVTEYKKNAFYPDLFTADAYGDLYTLQNATLYKYDERELLDVDGNGTRLFPTALSSVKKLAVDYERNVYALAGNAVYNLSSQTHVDFSIPQTFADNVNLTSFAFDVQENTAYLLCDGNYLLKTQKLQLPTVKTVLTENVGERIFKTQSANFSIVQTSENALLVEFDLNALQTATYFPYLSHDRAKTALTALKLDETPLYNVLAVFNARENRYHTYLTLKEFCTPVPTENYRIDYAEPDQKTAYLTSDVSLYKFPYLCDLLLVNAEKLPRGAKLTLLGEIGELDHDYYLVRFEDEQGATHQGYLPKTYATLFDASPKQTQQSTYGELQSDSDSLGRLGYLLLGGAAICILIDYLLLRKKKEE